MNFAIKIRISIKFYTAVNVFTSTNILFTHVTIEKVKSKQLPFS